jgi:hypothetical protein
MLPVELSIGLGESNAVKRVRVKVLNADTAPLAATGHLVKLIAGSGDCPSGIVVGAPDFDKRTAGDQDTVFLGGGKQGIATVTVAAVSTSFNVFNRRAPSRCRIMLSAQSQFPGNLDPAPSNNIYPLEVSVFDANDPEQTQVHESFLPSPRAAVARRVARCRW